MGPKLLVRGGILLPEQVETSRSIRDSAEISLLWAIFCDGGSNLLPRGLEAVDRQPCVSRSLPVDLPIGLARGHVIHQLVRALCDRCANVAPCADAIPRAADRSAPEASRPALTCGGYSDRTRRRRLLATVAWTTVDERYPIESHPTVGDTEAVFAGAAGDRAAPRARAARSCHATVIPETSACCTRSPSGNYTFRPCRKRSSHRYTLCRSSRITSFFRRQYETSSAIVNDESKIVKLYRLAILRSGVENVSR